MKPGSLLQLREGKLLDTFTGFVEFFNWMARFLFRLRSRGSIQSTRDADDTYYLDIKGFPEADDNTVPTKNADGAIEWKAQQGITPDEKSIWERDGFLEIYAFYDADADSVPVKNADGVIEWKPYGGGGGGGSDIKFVGTDGSEAILGDPSSTDFKTLTFASAADSKMVVNVTGDGSGNVTLTIGAYYV